MKQLDSLVYVVRRKLTANIFSGYEVWH